MVVTGFFICFTFNVRGMGGFPLPGLVHFHFGVVLFGHDVTAHFNFGDILLTLTRGGSTMMDHHGNWE
jgi:hypothetical protein